MTQESGAKHPSKIGKASSITGTIPHVQKSKKGTMKLVGPFPKSGAQPFFWPEGFASIDQPLFPPFNNDSFLTNSPSTTRYSSLESNELPPLVVFQLLVAEGSDSIRAM
jgi:hypothetical protein